MGAGARGGGEGTLTKPLALFEKRILPASRYVTPLWGVRPIHPTSRLWETDNPSGSCQKRSMNNLALERSAAGPPAGRKQKYFECSRCSITIPFHYQGRKPPFAPQMMSPLPAASKSRFALSRMLTIASRVRVLIRARQIPGGRVRRVRSVLGRAAAPVCGLQVLFLRRTGVFSSPTCLTLTFAHGTHAHRLTP